MQKIRNVRLGFTMTELLVVIAIIAILAAFLLPVFQKAKLKSHEATCISQMRQIAMTLNMYRSDHDGSDSGTTIVSMGLPPNSSYLIHTGYIKDNKIVTCPNAHISREFREVRSKHSSFSYEDYYTMSHFYSFPLRYQHDRQWPIIFCQFHDMEYWYSNGISKDDADVIAVSLSGSIIKRTFKEISTRPKK
jgi:prepilin-type N-terminal cleavage/methylation domain-containing protein